MKRGHEDVGHAAGPATWRKREGPKMKYCLKVLIPDVFASFLLRDKGSLKDELQQESESRLVFSNKGDFFPDTQLRVLGVYSDVSDGVTRALDLILGKMREHCAEDESVRRQPPPGCEMVGKEEGELILRLVLSREMTGLLIGSQGANIKELRRDSGCKINIRDDAVAAHRLTTLMGSPEQLQMALQKLAENMKTEAETESEEFQHYQRVINFGEEGAGWGYGKGGPGPGHGGSAKGGGYPPHSNFGPNVSGGLGFLGQDLDSMPPGTAELPYSISCALPAQLVPALIGRSGDFIRSIEERTGAKVDIAREGVEGYRKMECIGPLVCIYAAHSLMMHRLQEVENSPGPGAPQQKGAGKDSKKQWSSVFTNK
mmetsp:Transcript_21810/g.47822  ORF Transcript_21810/g.47822 Transcript_21810/m.47822 type:complete len:371 (-) Transcript_21810:99-1211(-)